MSTNEKKTNEKVNLPILITAGATYLDIDAYACCVALAELLTLKGENAIAYSCAPSNYSVCDFLISEGQINNKLPSDCDGSDLDYILVDISDPDFLKDSVPLDNVIEVYDHHPGYEKYWENKIGDKSHIEFIGAAATMIYREWKKAGLEDKMKRSTALLLIAAILDNTLNLTSSNTTQEDIDAFNEMCKKENVNEEWCGKYFSEAQKSVEEDLENSMFKDIKKMQNNTVLAERFAQLCVWNAESIIARMPEIRSWFEKDAGSWMVNLIDVKHRCSYFLCDDEYHQEKIGKVFDVDFESGIAKSSIPYLRKEIIKKAYFNNKIGG